MLRQGTPKRCCPTRPMCCPTTRSRRRLPGVNLVAGSNRSVADVAAEHGVSWPTAHRALVASAARWLPEPKPTAHAGSRQDPLRVGPLDSRQDHLATPRPVDDQLPELHTRRSMRTARAGTPAHLRLCKRRLGEQSEAFRRIEMVVIDPSAPYASGSAPPSRGVKIAIDKWHAGRASERDGYRCEAATHPQPARASRHGGRSGIGNRWLMPTGAEHLSSKQ
jgi:transposase